MPAVEEPWVSWGSMLYSLATNGGLKQKGLQGPDFHHLSPHRDSYCHCAEGLVASHHHLCACPDFGLIGLKS